MNIKHAFQLAVKDRPFLFISIGLLLLAFFIVVATGLNIHQSELQVPIRYSSFSVTQYFTDRWYYLINFALIALAVAVLHILIALRVYEQKGRDLALVFLGLGIGVVCIAAITTYAIFRVVLLTQ